MINQQLKRLKKIFLPLDVSCQMWFPICFPFITLTCTTIPNLQSSVHFFPTIKWKEIYKTIVGWTSEMAGLIHPGKQTFVIPLINPKKEFKIKNKHVWA